jgi:hypothetical protein
MHTTIIVHLLTSQTSRSLFINAFSTDLIEIHFVYITFGTDDIDAIMFRLSLDSISYELNKTT